MSKCYVLTYQVIKGQVSTETVFWRRLFDTQTLGMSWRTHSKDFLHYLARASSNGWRYAAITTRAPLPQIFDNQTWPQNGVYMTYFRRQTYFVKEKLSVETKLYLGDKSGRIIPKRQMCMYSTLHVLTYAWFGKGQGGLKFEHHFRKKEQISYS